MKGELKQIIRDIIKESYETQVNDIKNSFSRVHLRDIGKELNDYTKPKVSVKVGVVSPKNGRTYYHTELKYQTYIYTQEMYDEGLQKELSRIKPNCTHSFQVETDDSHRIIRVSDAFNLTDSEVEAIYNMYSPHYREKLKDFEIKLYHYSGENYPPSYQGIYPIFEGETNKEFYDAKSEYCRKKAEWCSKYGCD